MSEKHFHNWWRLFFGGGEAFLLFMSHQPLEDAAIKAPLVLSQAEVSYLLGSPALHSTVPRPFIFPETRSRSNSILSDKSSPSAGQEHRKHDPIDVAALRNGSEKRTTVTIRSLPRRMSEPELRELIDSLPGVQYDYLYLPPDLSRNKHNRGFAFINLVSSENVANLIEGVAHAPASSPLRSTSVAYTHFQGTKESLEAYVKIRRTIRH